MGRLGVGSTALEFCQRVDALINQIKQNTPGDVAAFDSPLTVMGKRRCGLINVV